MLDTVGHDVGYTAIICIILIWCQLLQLDLYQLKIRPASLKKMYRKFWKYLNYQETTFKCIYKFIILSHLQRIYLSLQV